MADLIVVGFKNMATADEAVKELEQMQREGLITLADWARVIRHEGGKTDVRQAVSTAGAGAAGGALWGMLIGLIFLAPFAGALVGGAVGALSGALTDIGIDDKFIKDVGGQIKPGTSALFLYVVQATTDKVVERMQRFQPEILRTNLSAEAEERLRQAVQPTPA
jgi:uncharacterized membrane protein